jgi:hypothetical protein
MRKVLRMTTIKATCPHCGDVDLTVPDVTLSVCPDLGWSTYEFYCITCGNTIKNSADEDVQGLLTRIGVNVVRVVVPKEVHESRRVALALPPLTMDDMIEFALELSSLQDVAGQAFAESAGE